MMEIVTTVPSAPVRDAESHKGTYGHLLVLAGSPRMAGAVLLTARAALRASPSS